MDIVGKLPVALGHKVFMLAMADYFSKWIEADSFRQVTEKEEISFIRKNIFCRYGIPSEIVCDNGTEFVGKKTIAFCAEWNINLVTSTPSYPKANGQAESNIPAEIRIPTSRYSLNNTETNDSLLQDILALTEELRDTAKIRITSYQQAIARSYNKNVKARVFREGDLVRRKNKTALSCPDQVNRFKENRPSSLKKRDWQD
ncbi:uncharacterized protein LOC141607811 [Silene latifolia]|uniref:uncharacterized protein LOC141607811 n=1 Tax=Silene latifolia TaxID=37657 RepID=UPI003D785D59